MRTLSTDSTQLLSWVVANLPTDIVYRRQILNGFYQLLPDGDPRESIASLLNHLDLHIGLQREFGFSETAEPGGPSGSPGGAAVRGGRRLSDKENPR